MRIGVQSWGSEGDNRPLIALARLLDAAGHEVRLALADVGGMDPAPLLEGSGVVLAGTCRASISRGEMEELGRRSIAEPDPLRQLGFVMRHLFDPMLDALHEQAARLADSSDVLVGHFVLHPLATVAERRGLPHVSVTTTPVIPSGCVPPPGFPPLPRPLTACLWKIGIGMLSRMAREPINGIRRREGLPPVKKAFMEACISRRLNLLPLSPTLFPRPPDWSPRHQVTGWLGTALPDTSAPDPALEDFLEAGPPPVYATAGSMMLFDPDPAGHLELVCRAAREAGCRLVLQHAGQGTEQVADRPDVHLVGRANHSGIFPRCSAILHHGGAGTTHAACLSGRPSVVVAYGVDQVFWGPSLHRLGVAPPTLRRRGLTGSSLVRALRTATSSEDMRRRAEEIGRSMSREDGPAEAVRLIEGVTG